MINWQSVIANGLWITGLAIILAGVSYYYWLAGQMKRPLAQELAAPPFQRLLLFGLLLVGVGLALTANGVWQILLAGALIIVCIVALYTLFTNRPNTPTG